MRSIIVSSMVVFVTFNVINGMALPRSHYNRVHLSRRALHSHNPSVSVLRRDLIPVLSETVQEEVFDDKELLEYIDGFPKELVEAKKVQQEAMDQVLELPFEKRLKIGKIFKKAVSVAGSIGKTAMGMAMGG